jgi:glycosyltransferase involved in cell wall biosynthesis
LKVLMIPNLTHFAKEESGIRRVVENYQQYGKEVVLILFIAILKMKINMICWQYTLDQFPNSLPLVQLFLSVTGLYWTADYKAANWEYGANANVINAIRKAREVTVPSRWVAETFQRDMHFTPHVVPHGIDWQAWQHQEENHGYVLWNKNRAADVCDPTPVKMLAETFPKIKFITTFSPDFGAGNIRPIRIQPHHIMKGIIQRAGVYLSTTKETFGIGILEAMASGVPVLGWRFGGNIDLVKHGVTGYLAQPGNYKDLENGLNYCMMNRTVLGDNARIYAKRWKWLESVRLLHQVFSLALEEQPPTVCVVIPTYNYGTEEQLGRAIRSVLSQSYPRELLEIVVVNDGSDDGGQTDNLVDKIMDSRRDDPTPISIRYVRQPNQGVAAARNNGIRTSTAKYICCLDADDAIAPTFIDVCVDALEKDQALGIAYTGLWYRIPDGREGLSNWPTDYDFDRQLIKQNQIPTCCVFRRRMWERLGGYRQRYAPGGAGAEDAEFWLRAGAYGWNARKVTAEGLFLYSWMSGRVSGDKNYKEMDWTVWHPWTKDGQHPFASMAKPKHMSHPVRQYDEPIISVVIPVGPGHEDEIINALDSLEAQTFRKWEAIVVWDSINPVSEIMASYPFVRLIGTDKDSIVSQESKGAGYARNRGAEIARGYFLVFLDADDWLYPQALDKMMAVWETQESIVYADYIGKGIVDDTSKLSKELRDNLLDWNEKTKVAVIKHKAADYNCERAILQPVVGEDNKINDVYLWANVTCLIPIEWHRSIGGFDESMESWEDVDYHWRMARSGHCYTRIPEELLVYRFYSGSRRQKGLQSYGHLIKYLQEKYKEFNTMACSGCGGKTAMKPTPKIIPGANTNRTVENTMSDNDFVLTEYMHMNRGQHSVVGASTGIKYGYRGGGDIFLVHKNDIAVQPHLFRAVRSAPEQTSIPRPPEPSPIVEPEIVEVEEQKTTEEIFLGPEAEEDVPEIEEVIEQEKFDLQTIPGVTPAIADALAEMGGVNPREIIKLGVNKIKKIKGVGPTRAFLIYDGAKKIRDSE